MTLAFSRPADLEHGDKFGKLTVLKKEKRKDRSGNYYRVGCVCGHSGMLVTASALRSGRIAQCVRCRNTGMTVANTSAKPPR